MLLRLSSSPAKLKTPLSPLKSAFHLKWRSLLSCRGIDPSPATKKSVLFPCPLSLFLSSARLLMKDWVFFAALAEQGLA